MRKQMGRGLRRHVVAYEVAPEIVSGGPCGGMGCDDGMLAPAPWAPVSETFVCIRWATAAERLRAVPRLRRVGGRAMPRVCVSEVLCFHGAVRATGL